MTVLRVMVPAKPVSTNATYRAGKGNFWKTAEAKAYQNAVRLYARQAAMAQGWTCTDKPVSVVISFTFASKLSDVDGPTKGTLDSLEGIAYANDRQVKLLSISKDVGPNPSVTIEVREA